MQLLVAHQILIAAAITLATLFGMRALVLFSRGGGSADLVAGLVSLALAAVLIAYLRKVRARWAELKKEPPRR